MNSVDVGERGSSAAIVVVVAVGSTVVAFATARMERGRNDDDDWPREYWLMMFAARILTKAISDRRNSFAMNSSSVRSCRDGDDVDEGD